MPKIEMQKIKREELKQMLQRTGLPRREIAKRLGLKTPSIFFKWMKNAEIPSDRLATLNRLVSEAAGSANPASELSRMLLHNEPDRPDDLAHVTDIRLINELARRGWNVRMLLESVPTKEKE